MYLVRFIYWVTFILILYSCSKENIIYSGKIINQENLNNLNINSKNQLIQNFGQPSFIDPIENKFFYYFEKTKENNFYSTKSEYSYIFVFKFDDNGKISNKKIVNLNDMNQSDILKGKTENNIIKRGFIERIFGGVGAQKFPDT